MPQKNTFFFIFILTLKPRVVVVQKSMSLRYEPTVAYNVQLKSAIAQNETGRGSRAAPQRYSSAVPDVARCAVHGRREGLRCEGS